MPEQLKDIPLEDILPPIILLRLVDRTCLDYIELRDSVSKHGFFASVCVRPSLRDKGKYELIDGTHRYCVAMDCGFKTLPCIIKDATDAEVKNWQVQANLIRRETTNSQYAERLKILFCENPDLTMEVLSVELNCRPEKLQKILRLNRLIDVAKIHLDRGDLPLTSAYALSKLPKQIQADLFESSLIMGAKEFVQLCNGYGKSFREALYEGRLEKYLQSIHTPVPHLRKFSQIKDEYEKLIVGPETIQRIPADHKIDIWKAALAWVLHLDPVSLARIQELVAQRSVNENRQLLKERVGKHKVPDGKYKATARYFGIDADDQDLLDLVM